MDLLSPDWWQDNWLNVLTVVGTVVSILAIVLAAVWRRWDRERMEPKYATSSFKMLRNAISTIPELELKYRGFGQPLDTLTVTKLIFWNAGRKPIKKADVADTDPVRITITGDSLILGAKVIRVTSDKNQLGVTLHRDRKEIAVTFKYLQHNEGVGIEIFHTGPDNMCLQMAGTIIGSDGIKRVVHHLLLPPNYDPRRDELHQFRRIFLVTMCLMLAPTVISPALWTSIAVPFVVGIIGFLFANYWMFKRRIPPSLDDD